MTSFADFEPLTSDEGVTFTPWTDGHAVGFRITREQDDRVEFVVLSPSSAHNRPGWDGRGDVFVYRAVGAECADDVYGSPACFLDVFDPDDYRGERPEVPADFPVRPLQDPVPNDPEIATCGVCGRSWDDAIVTAYTPAPSARCPFEAFH